MITSADIVAQLLTIIDKACRRPTAAEVMAAWERGEASRILLEANRLAGMLDAWRDQAPWPPFHSNAPPPGPLPPIKPAPRVERANRDPTAHALAQAILGIILEAAMLARGVIERGRCLSIIIPYPGDPRPCPPESNGPTKP